MSNKVDRCEVVPVTAAVIAAITAVMTFFYVTTSHQISTAHAKIAVLLVTPVIVATAALAAMAVPVISAAVVVVAMMAVPASAYFLYYSRWL